MELDFNGQNFNKLRNLCLSNGKLFEDDTFPAEMKSIYRYKLPSELNGLEIVWKRPHELVSNPEFIVNGIDAKDLYQGNLSNCWLISAIAAVANAACGHLNWVIYGNQTFDASNGYCGLFHFRFWKYGQWYDVVVDDRLPVAVNDTLAAEKKNWLVFCSNKKDRNEFWGPLLEKAYAKFSSCYEFVNLGYAEIAIVNLTGGFSELINVQKTLQNRSKEAMWRLLESAYLFKSSSTAGIPPRGSEKAEHKRDNGLHTAHAYSINKIIHIRPNQLKENPKNYDKIYLLKLRNPWGEAEWKGDWDDNYPEWNYIEDSAKNELKIVKDNDGEFWMSFEDFINNFILVRIAHVNANAFTGNNNAICPFTSRIKWKYFSYHGESVINNIWGNVQCLISLKNACKSKINPEGANENSLIVSMMCKEDIREMKKGIAAPVTIELRVYRILDETSISEHKLKSLKYQSHELGDPFVDKQVASVSQEFGYRFNLKEGNYVVIGFVKFVTTPCKYFARILTETDMEITESCILKNQDENFIEGGSANDDNMENNDDNVDFNWF